MVFLLPILAVVIGYVLSLFIRPSSSTSFQLLLSFSGAFLLSITVLELLPEVYSSQQENVGVFIMLGLLIQIFLEYLSKGVEHGHMHHHEEKAKFPLLLLASLSIHALLEGFPLRTTEDLLHGVVIHKIPVAAILSAFLIHSNISKPKLFLFLGFFAMMTPLGSWLQSNLEGIEAYSTIIHACVIGIFLHVSTTILFEASKNHSFNASKLIAIVGAILLAFFL